MLHDLKQNALQLGGTRTASWAEGGSLLYDFCPDLTQILCPAESELVGSSLQNLGSQAWRLDGKKIIK